MACVKTGSIGAKQSDQVRVKHKGLKVFFFRPTVTCDFGSDHLSKPASYLLVIHQNPHHLWQMANKARFKLICRCMSSLTQGLEFLKFLKFFYFTLWCLKVLKFLKFFYSSLSRMLKVLKVLKVLLFFSLSDAYLKFLKFLKFFHFSLSRMLKDLKVLKVLSFFSLSDA